MRSGSCAPVCASVRVSFECPLRTCAHTRCCACSTAVRMDGGPRRMAWRLCAEARRARFSASPDTPRLLCASTRCTRSVRPATAALTANASSPQRTTDPFTVGACVGALRAWTNARMDGCHCKASGWRGRRWRQPVSRMMRVIHRAGEAAEPTDELLAERSTETTHTSRG